MPLKKGVTVDNHFIGGRITQATGLNFPENACTDELNCIFNERGFITRRPSFDFENNHLLNNANRTNNAITEYLWKNASDDGSSSLVVKQVGNTLFFYSADSATGLSSSILAGTVDISSFLPAGGSNANLYECQFASGLGKLFVVNPRINPFAVSYDSTTHALTTTVINIQIRDFEGITDTVTSTTQRPATLTNAHKYNLLNQGWDVTKIATFFTDLAVYPSNADVWWIFKDATNVFTPAATNASNTRGNAQSPKGSYILDAFNLDRTTASGVSGITVVTSSLQRPSAVAFYEGRLFYSGVSAPGFTDRVYFTQIIERPEQYGMCYQQADSTAEDIFEITPADGGVLRIPGAGQIFKLVNLNNYLIHLAAHGIWLIGGSNGVGFSATDYMRTTLSSTKTLSASSFIDIQGYPAWWNIDGINVIKPDAQGGLVVDSLTDAKIKDLFLEIPIASKRYARGAYNSFTHVAQWIYRSDAPTSFEEGYEFDTILNFNILSGAFYFWEVPTTHVKLHGIIVADTGGSSVINIYNVVDIATDTVVDAAGDTVIVYGLGTSSTIHTTTKYLVSYGTVASSNFTWSECADFRGDYLDWKTYDDVGEDYTSYLTTGYKVHSEGQRRTQVPYVYVFSNNDEGTQYIFQSLWDYASTGDESRWANPQLIVHDSESSTYVRRKIRLRGHGVAVQFKFSSVTGIPFNLIGWSTIEEANSSA